MHMFRIIPLFAAFSALVNALAIPTTPATALDAVSVVDHDIIKKTVAMIPDAIEDRAKDKVDIAKVQDTVGQFKKKMFHTFKIREESSPPDGGNSSAAGNLEGIVNGATFGLGEGLGDEKPVASVGEAVGSVVHVVGGGVSEGASNGAAGAAIGGLENGIF